MEPNFPKGFEYCAEYYDPDSRYEGPRTAAGDRKYFKAQRQLAAYSNVLEQFDAACRAARLLRDPASAEPADDIARLPYAVRTIAELERRELLPDPDGPNEAEFAKMQWRWE